MSEYDQKTLNEINEIHDAPPMSARQEREWSTKLRAAKIAAFGSDKVIITSKKHPMINVEAGALYWDLRDSFAYALGYIPTKVAHKFKDQCQKGMELRDLFNEGYVAIMKAIDHHEFRDIKSICTNKRMRCDECGTVFLPKKNKDICPCCKHLTKCRPLCGHVIDQPDIKRCPKCGESMGSPVFSGFVVGVVSNDVWRFIDKNNRTIQIPSSVLHIIYMNEKTKHLPIEEQAKIIRCSIDVILSVILPPVSLDHTIDGESPITSMIAKESDDGGVGAKRRNLIYRALIIMARKRGHHRRMAKIMRDAFIRVMTYEQIGEKYGFTKQRAKQMVIKAVNNIRQIPEAMRYLWEAIKIGREAA